jgi:hypothetical protein
MSKKAQWDGYRYQDPDNVIGVAPIPTTFTEAEKLQVQRAQELTERVRQGLDAVRELDQLQKSCSHAVFVKRV